MKSGFLLIDKPVDMTSNDLVRIVKKKLNVNKAGHSGTLDPDVTGLVIVAVGAATKLLPLITQDSKKEYECILKLGIKTDTDDSTGEIIESKEITEINEMDVKNVLKEFEKTYEQYPPIYSAKRVNGMRLYQYAREGIEVDIKPSLITIYSNKLHNLTSDTITFSSIVSKGTYMRSLCVDIAAELNNIGTMDYLRRLSTDGFNVNDAISVEMISYEHMLDIEDFIRERFATYEVYGPIADMIKNGAVLNIKNDITYPCAYVDKETNKVIAIYKKHKEDKVKPLVML